MKWNPNLMVIRIMKAGLKIITSSKEILKPILIGKIEYYAVTAIVSESSVLTDAARNAENHMMRMKYPIAFYRMKR